MTLLDVVLESLGAQLAGRSCERCGQAFLSDQPAARFCSERCRRRAKETRRLQQNSDYLRRRIARQSARYHNDPIYKEHRKELYYRRHPDAVERRRLREQRRAAREVADAAIRRRRANRQARIAAAGGPAEYHRMKARQYLRKHRRTDAYREAARISRQRAKSRRTDAQWEKLRARWRRRNSNPKRRRKEGERKAKYAVLVRALREVGLLDGCNATGGAPAV
jgi:hypothetical protein